MVLLELQKCCPEVFEHLEVYVDGGIRRGIVARPPGCKSKDG